MIAGDVRLETGTEEAIFSWIQAKIRYGKLENIESDRSFLVRDARIGWQVIKMSNPNLRSAWNKLL